MNRGSKDILNFLARIGLSLLLLWFVFSKIDIGKTRDVLQGANAGILGIGFFVFVIVNTILLFRWLVFIKALGVEASLWNVIRNHLIGLFGNLFLPSAIGGDVLKTLGMCKGSSQKSRVVASVIIDRLSGFASIVLVAIGAFVIGFEYIDDEAVLAGIATMGVVSIFVALVLFNEKAYSLGCRVFAFFPKAERALMNIHYDIALLKDKKSHGLFAVIVSCVSQLTFASMWFIVGKSLNQDTALIYFIIFVPLTNIAASVPSIGGLGVREAGAVYLFSKVGVEPGVAVSISLICYMYMVLIGCLGGLIYVFTLSSGRIQRDTADAGLDSAEV